MVSKNLNRIKVVLAEKQRSNKWLAEQLGKGPATVSKWCTNSAQPNLENLVEIAKCLNVDVSELIRKEDQIKDRVSNQEVELNKISYASKQECI